MPGFNLLESAPYAMVWEVTGKCRERPEGRIGSSPGKYRGSADGMQEKCRESLRERRQSDEEVTEDSGKHRRSAVKHRGSAGKAPNMIMGSAGWNSNGESEKAARKCRGNDEELPDTRRRSGGAAPVERRVTPTLDRQVSSMNN